MKLQAPIFGACFSFNSLFSLKLLTDTDNNDKIITEGLLSKLSGYFGNRDYGDGHVCALYCFLRGKK